MVENIQKEINELREQLDKYKNESLSLKKAIWDMLNYSNLFVVILDEKLNIKLCNYNLARVLGFKSEEEILEKCWLDFIPENNREIVKQIHGLVKICAERDDEKYKEVINDILLPNGETMLVRWFNMCINHNYNMTFSIGVEQATDTKSTDESVRAYYKGIIEKDRTMINSLRDLVLSANKPVSTCNPSL